MPLKRKLLIGYGVTFTLMGLVIVWAVVNIISLGNATDAILSENYRSILAAENMVDALERQDSGILLIFMGEREEGMAQFHKYETTFIQWLARAKDNITIQGEMELVRSLENGYEKYRRRFSDLTGMLGGDEPTLQPGFYRAEIHPLFSKVREACVNLRNLNEKTMYAASVTAGDVAERAIWSTSVVAASAIIVALAFSFFLAGRIVGPIRRFMDASRKISEGDYSVQVPVETGDELGRLAVEFNQMADQLNRYNDMNIEQIISEKNKGEAILASIEDGLVVFDTSLKVTGINPAARNMLDLGFADTSTLDLEDIIPSPRIRDLIQETVHSGTQPDISDEDRILTLPEGEQPRHYMFSVTVVRGRDRRFSGIVLLLRDITRLKEVERLKSEFIMAASHELRMPLTSLGMSVDLLLERAPRSLSGKDRELLQAAHEEVHRMKALISDLLDLSKIESGRIELEFESIRVSSLIDHIKEVFKSQMEMQGVTFDTRLAGDSLRVRADANKITWVLTNLISNALRYAGQNGHIEVTAQKIGPHAHLSVSDDGPGIPPEYQSRIFQKFVQVEGRETEGTGLGLAICKEIVRAHGGAIWVESTPGQGSTFTFTIPAV